MTKNAMILSASQSVKGNPACFFCQCLFEKISIGATHSLDAGLSRLFSPCPPVRGRIVPCSSSRWDRK